MRKKRLVFQSDFALANTGFGRNTKALLEYLYKKDKYEITNYAVGINWSNPALKNTPWKSIGTLPDSQAELNNLNKDPNLARRASYGDYNLNRVIEQEKPDVYIAAQDIWGVDFATEKPWFNKITSALWTTLDSLPILPAGVESAKKSKNYWIWGDFATKVLNKMGHKNVLTMHGAIESHKFYRFLNSQRCEIRKKNQINEKDFIIGFVFRNQLRKSVPNLLEGFSIFKRNNPTLKTKLLLHTHFSEGWGILKLADEYKVNHSDILATHICKACRSYSVKNFTGEDSECPHCKVKAAITTNVSIGVTEEQLNEVYNLMDVYCHPFTSGGQEIPIQEAKMTELVTLVTNYSCGEDMCVPEANSMPLEWSEYREHGTEFIKASTSPTSIAKQLQKVLDMDAVKKREMEKKARKWALDNFSVEVIGKKIEDFIDSAPFIDNLSVETPDQNPYAKIEDLQDNSEWIKSLYLKILNRTDGDKDNGVGYWLEQLAKGSPRADVENYFRQVAKQENDKNKKVDFLDLLDKEDAGRRMICVMPENSADVLLLTSLFKSLKETYPNYNLYIATKPEFFKILEANEYVHKLIAYSPQMDQLLWLEGQGAHDGYFEIAFLPHLGSQRMLNYQHNGKDKIAFSIKD